MLELLKTRRSIRKYQDRAVEKEKVDAIIQSGLMSPSSRGRRPWEFILVDDRDLLHKLSLSRGQVPSFVADAPLAIVVTADSKTNDVWIEDASIAAIIMQVTAHSLGLGSCWNHIRARMHNDEMTAEDYVREVLNIPEQYSILCILAIGYPDETKEPYKLDQLPYEKVHTNGF
jgi:nitroreductase